MKIAFCGGGTGGHIFPIKSLIEYIFDNKEINGKIEEIYWVGENDSLEQKVAYEFKNKVTFKPIFSGKLRREKSFQAVCRNLIDIIKLKLGVVQCIYFLLVNKVDVIFCKGGYVALPLVIAGWILRKRIFLHESDTIPGLANKVASKFAKTKFVGFPNVLKDSVCVGQILSKGLLNYGVKFDRLLLDKLDITKTNVLFMGGSQGSQTLYESLVAILEKNPMSEFNFFVVLGTKNEGFKSKLSKFDNVVSYDFLSQSEIGKLYEICDLGVTRGGATSMAEQKAFGMDLIIVPLPYTGGNHQYYNGLFYQDEYQDTLLDQFGDLENDLFDSLNHKKGFKKNININDVNFDENKKEIFSKIIGL